ncbi:MAG: hypothetical protein U9O94_01460 [Nanoarchaeota archaeon]|nr:hypothetical protein [Nanoarchaeota archaeon]
MKRYIFLVILLVLAVASGVHAADIVSTDGMPNDSGIYPIQVDTDGVITIASDAGLKLAYEAATTSDTLTASESGKTLSVDCSTPCEFELPAAVAGMSFSFISDNNDATFSVDPNGTDTIKWSNGAAPLAAGDKLTSPGATEDSITLFSTASGYWSVKEITGTFTDGN